MQITTKYDIEQAVFIVDYENSGYTITQCKVIDIIISKVHWNGKIVIRYCMECSMYDRDEEAVYGTFDEADKAANLQTIEKGGEV